MTRVQSVLSKDVDSAQCAMPYHGEHEAGGVDAARQLQHRQVALRACARDWVRGVVE